MTDNFDPFVNLVVEPGENQFIALKRSFASTQQPEKECSLLLPSRQTLGIDRNEPPKLPRDVQLYIGLLTCVGLYIVYRFTQKGS